MPEWVNVMIGPDIWAAEKIIGALPQFYKGLTIGERDAKIRWWAEGDVILETDFSKYDRTEGIATRFMERCIMRLLLLPEDFEVFSAVMTALETKAKIVHVAGIGLSGLCQRWTGEPGTSIWNGCWNMFASWLAAQRQGIDYWDPAVVRASVEGDDGMLIGVEPQVWIDSATDLGLEVKVEVKCGLFDTSFLGRVHAVGSDGKFRSMSDLPRALKKWHLSPSSPEPNVTPDQLLAGKCLAYLATDYHSPVLGAVAWAFLQWTDSDPALGNDLARRLSLGDISWTDIRSKPAPPFDHMLAATYAHWYGIGIDILHDLHKEYVHFGCGGPIPRLLSLPVVAGPENLALV